MEEDRDQIEIEPSDLIELEEEKVLRRAAEIKAKRIKAAGRSACKRNLVRKAKEAYHIRR